MALLFLGVFFALALLAKIGLLGTHFNVMNEALSFTSPSWTYWLGGDIFGRDIFARGLHGAFTAFTVGLVAATISTVIGGVLGLVAGYYEGYIDDAIVAAFTVLESIPYILLLTAIAFLFGQGLINVFLSLGLTSWVVLCRLVRTECRKHKYSDYVLAARALGLSERAILFRHILPNVRHILLAQFVIVFVFAIKAEVVLTYLGLGVEPGFPSWGYMLDEARQELVNGFWWNFVCATGMMCAVVLALNSLLGDEKL